MNTRQCRYMLTIAEQGYLSHAADALGVSQAALSKFLEEQERLAGVSLFVRQKKRLLPTAAGTVYLEAAEQFLQIKNQTLQAMGRGQKYTTSLRVVSTPYRGAEMFSRVYTHAMARFPQLNLQLSEAFSRQQETIIHEGKADFACGVHHESQHEDVVSQPITREEVLLAIPSSHPLAHRASGDSTNLSAIALSDLRDTPFVLPSAKSNLRLIANDRFAEAGFEPVIAFESENNMAVSAMLAQGAMAGFISRRYETERPELVYFRLEPPCYEYTCIRYRKGRVFTEEELYLCGLIIRERASIPWNELLHTEDLSRFLGALAGSGIGGVAT